jgi:hypothetical protein
MSSIYKYFHESKIKIDNFEKALKRIETEKLIISSEHLPVLEAAEREDFHALCEMAVLFSDGAKGIQPNYKISKHYHKIIQEKNKGDPITEYESHRGIAFLEMNFQNLEAAKYELIEAVKLMVNNFPLEQWNFNPLHNLEKILQYQAENQAQE